MRRENEPVRTFYLDAMMVDGKPTGVLKENITSGNCNANTPNTLFLSIAAERVCHECPLKQGCAPQKIKAKPHLFGLVENSELWIAGNEVQKRECELCANGIPQETYDDVASSFEHR